MDLGTQLSSTADLLSSIGAGVQDRNRLIVEEWQAIVAWARRNVVDAPAGAATLREGFLDTGLPVAGDGAPLVSEFALMELVAVLGRSPDGGRAYVGRVLGCAWRLPELYRQVIDGVVEPWRAERVADLTHCLSFRAAAHVDHHLSRAVGGVSWALIERLVAEAMLRFDPEQAEAERQRAADQRRFDIGAMDDNGLLHVDGTVDAADGHDLDLAIAREAHLLGRLGDDSSLDVRRAKAVGALARRDLALDLLIADEDTGEVVAEVPGRKVTLNVHITDAALAGPFGIGSANPVARWDEGHGPVLTQQVEEWLQVPGTTVTVRPVIDLADCVPVDAYEVPDRHRARIELRDHTCRFPRCTRPAGRCDVDHAVPYADGGVTCPCNEVALCRRHHRAKTHSSWAYRVLAPAHYLWTSPHRNIYLVTPAGTFPLDPAAAHRR